MSADIYLRLQEIAQLAEKATQGKWHKDNLGNIYATPSGNWSDRKSVVLVTKIGEILPSDPDADYIAHVNPADMLDLIEEITGCIAYLEHKVTELDIEKCNAESSVKTLEREAEWLAEYSARDECPLETLEWDKNSEDRPQWCDWHRNVNGDAYGCECSGDQVECWRRAAQDALQKEDKNE